MRFSPPYSPADGKRLNVSAGWSQNWFMTGEYQLENECEIGGASVGWEKTWLAEDEEIHRLNIQSLTNSTFPPNSSVIRELLLSLVIKTFNQPGNHSPCTIYNWCWKPLQPLFPRIGIPSLIALMPFRSFFPLTREQMNIIFTIFTLWIIESASSWAGGERQMAFRCLDCWLTKPRGREHTKATAIDLRWTDSSIWIIENNNNSSFHSLAASWKPGSSAECEAFMQMWKNFSCGPLFVYWNAHPGQPNNWSRSLFLNP